MLPSHDDWVIPIIPALSHSNIYDVEKDSKGVLWIGTDLGLYSFDGEKITNYGHNQGVVGNEVFEIFIDGKNQIWISTNTALLVLRDGRFHNINIGTPKLITSISESPNGSMLVTASPFGIYRVELQGEKFICNPIQSVNSEKYSNPHIIHFESEDIVILRHRLGILRYNLTTSIAEKLNNGLEYHPSIYWYDHLPDGSVIFNFNNKIISYLDGHIKTYINLSENVGSFCLLAQKKLIISKNDRTLALFDLETQQFTDSINFKLFKINRVKYIGPDCWLCTNKGIYKICISAFNAHPLKISTLNPGEIYIGWKFGKDANQYWSDSGRLIIKRTSSTSSINFHCPSRHNIRGIEESNGLTIASGLGPFTYAENGVINRSQQSFGSVKSVFSTIDYMFVSTSSGVYRFNKEDVNRVLLHPIKQHGDSLLERCIIPEKVSQFQHQGDFLWMISTSGIHIYNTVLEHRIIWGQTLEPIQEFQIFNNGNEALLLSGFGNLYVANVSDSWVVRKIGTISQPGAKLVQIDGKPGYLSQKGVYVLDPISSKPVKLYNFERFPGLVDLVDLGIKWQILCEHGVYSIDQDDLELSRDDLIIYWQEIRANDVQLLDTTAILKFNESTNFHFNVASPNLALNSELVYYWKIKEISDGWKISTSSEFQIPRLASGDYTIIARCEDLSNGVQSNQLGFSLTVSSDFFNPWNLNIWIVLVLIGALTFALYRLSARNNKIASFNLKINELEQIANRAQVSPHMIFNLMSSLKVMAETRPREEISESIELFAQYIRQTLDYSDRLFIFIEDEIQLLENYVTLEKRRFGDRIIVLIERPSNLHEKTIEFPAMLLQPIVENAIKHGFKSDSEILKIEVNFKITSSEITVTVKDDGRGIDPFQPRTDKSRKPWGLNLVRQRIFLIEKFMNVRASLTVTNRSVNKSQGTIVEIRVPRIH
jgi:anti-sigma regulatory factor (Ser/Thr protein kinase)